MWRLALAVFVWKKLMPLKVAKKMDEVLGNQPIPNTVEEIIRQIEKAEKEVRSHGRSKTMGKR